MNRTVWTLEAIGEIRTPFQKAAGMPIQAAACKEVEGQVILQPQYEEGLADIEGFSHLILIYLFHQSHGHDLLVTPFLDDSRHGVFATRAPRRPNPIGISVVALEERKGAVLHVRGIDVLDHTPLLDIKPFVPDFDAPAAVRAGWLEGRTGDLVSRRSDDRFQK